MTARRTAHPIALFLIDRAPPRIASEPPCVLLVIAVLERGPEHNMYGEKASYDGIPRVFFPSDSVLVLGSARVT
jgi:hypothetical protein